jgi:hypothetical protein
MLTGKKEKPSTAQPMIDRERKREVKDKLMIVKEQTSDANTNKPQVVFEEGNGKKNY